MGSNPILAANDQRNTSHLLVRRACCKRVTVGVPKLRSDVGGGHARHGMHTVPLSARASGPIAASRYREIPAGRGREWVLAAKTARAAGVMLASRRCPSRPDVVRAKDLQRKLRHEHSRSNQRPRGQ